MFRVPLRLKSFAICWSRLHMNTVVLIPVPSIGLYHYDNDFQTRCYRRQFSYSLNTLSTLKTSRPCDIFMRCWTGSQPFQINSCYAFVINSETMPTFRTRKKNLRWNQYEIAKINKYMKNVRKKHFKMLICKMSAVLFQHQIQMEF